MASFVSAFSDDYDLRFEETRHRRLRLIALENPDEKSLKELTEEWREAPERVSYLDWAQLMKWSEEYRRLHLKYLIHSTLRKLMQEDLNASQRAILNRMREIENRLKRLPSPERASFFELIYLRWTIPALLQETEYLIGRLDHN